MAILLKILGGGWAFIGALNIVSMPWWAQSGDHSGWLSFGIIFNMFLFVVPGLSLYGFGALITKRRGSEPRLTQAEWARLSHQPTQPPIIDLRPEWRIDRWSATDRAPGGWPRP
jgi:hypothetical protein